MKKIMFALLVMISGSLFSYSDGYQGAFLNGNIVVQGGLGLALDPFGDIVVPPLSVMVDYGKEIELGNGLILPLSFGATMGYYKTEYKYDWYTYNHTYNYKWEYSDFYFGGRAAYHLNKLAKWTSDKVDLYGGVMIGFEVISSDFSSSYNGSQNDWYSEPNNDSSLIMDTFGGIRYFFTPQLGGYAEIGYGIEWFKIGLSYKL